MKIVADNHIPFIHEYFASYGELVLLPGREISTADVKEADILLVRSITPVNEKLLAGSSVKFVGSVTAGSDHLDTHWLDEAGINWSVALGFNAPPVADYVVSSIAALQRKQILSVKNIKAAVVGVGNVGRLVAQRLQLLNVDVVLCDPYRAESEADFKSVNLTDLQDVDFISLHVPLTRTGKYPTYHFINKQFMQRQKDACVILNASRGAVVNSEDLLKYGQHLHWCLDVWEQEPYIKKEVLAQALIATPHIAGYSVQSKIRGIDDIYRIACEKNIIAAQTMLPVSMPRQELTFAGENHHWQDIVMGIFNPLVMTAMLRTKLANAGDEGQTFDDMRNQFNYRHEFAYTRVLNTKLSTEDMVFLSKLGLQLDF